ncbi:hypothetical protein IAT40_005896 [Kwoniella sp. CBS 6097]
MKKSQPDSSIHIDSASKLNISIRSADTADATSHPPSDDPLTLAEGSKRSATTSLQFDNAMLDQVKALGVQRAEPESIRVCMPNEGELCDPDLGNRPHCSYYTIESMVSTPNPQGHTTAPTEGLTELPMNPTTITGSNLIPASDATAAAPDLAQRIYSQWQSAEGGKRLPHVVLRRGVTVFPVSTAKEYPDPGAPLKEPDDEGYQNASLFCGLGSYDDPNDGFVGQPSRLYLSDIGVVARRDRLDPNLPLGEQDHSYAFETVKLDDATKATLQHELDFLQDANPESGARHFPWRDPTVFGGDYKEGTDCRAVIAWNDQLESVAGTKERDTHFGFSTSPAESERFPGPTNAAGNQCYNSTMMAWRVLESQQGAEQTTALGKA